MNTDEFGTANVTVEDARTIDVLDGRQLEIEVSGPADGLPLIFHHGTPGARSQFSALRHGVHQRGMRLVTFSRPGYGGSTRQPGRRVVDAAADVRAVLGEIGAERCLVAGWSGGGPHALATAAILKERVHGCLIIAGVAPFDAPGLDFLAGMGEQNIEEFGSAVAGEDSLRAALAAEAAHLRDTDAAGIVAGLASLLPEVDRAVLDEEFGRDMATSFAQALRVSVDGWLDDDLAFVSAWGFDLGALDVPVFLWQGSADLMVPYAHGQWLASHIPGVRAHLLAGEGHLSITLGLLEEMLDELQASAR